MASHRVVILDLFSWWFFSDGIMGWNSLQNPPFGRVFFSTFSRHRRVASQIQKILEFDPKTSKKDLRFFLKFHSKFPKKDTKFCFHRSSGNLGDSEKMSPPPFFRKKFRGLIEKRGLAGADPGGGMKGLGLGKRGKNRNQADPYLEVQDT